MNRKIVVILTALLFTAVLFASCSALSDSEAAAITCELVEKSLPLNEIYFGEGLPYTKTALSEATEAAASRADTDIETVIYHPVADDAQYTAIDALKAATEEVFTDDYCDILYTITFTGVAGESDEASGVSYGAVYARYIEDYGVLTVNSRYDNPLPPRTYDYDSISIDKASERFITAQLDSYVNGEFDCRVTVELVNTDDGWRIDSPTY